MAELEPVPIETESAGQLKGEPGVDDSAYDEAYNGTNDDMMDGDLPGEKRKKPKKKNFRPMKRKKVDRSDSKPPLMVLNEKFGKSEFNIQPDPSSGTPGQTNSTEFVAKVTVNEVEYEGRGKSKQKAKTDAAAKALIAHGIPFLSETPEDRQAAMMQPFGQMPPPFAFGMRPGMRSPRPPFQMPFGPRFGGRFPGPGGPGPRVRPPAPRPELWGWEKAPGEPDFNSDTMEMDDPSLGQSFDNDAKNLVQHAEGMGPVFMKQLLQLNAMKITVSIEKARHFPAMVLSEFFPDAKDKITWYDQGTSQIYRCGMNVWGRNFVAEGKGRRGAKNNLAKVVLGSVLGIRPNEFEDPPKSTNNVDSEQSNEPKPFARRHPFSQVRILDPKATYTFESVKDESGEEKWCAKVTVRDKEFQATHKNKKVAKVHAAKEAGQGFEPPPDSELPVSAPPQQQPKGWTPKEVDTSKHPVQLFHEFYPQVIFDEQVVPNLKGGGQQYVLSVDVEHNVFAEQGSSKKKAKLRLAMQVFEALHNVVPDSWTMITPAAITDTSQETTAIKAPSGKSPLMLLNELHPKCEYDITEGKSEEGKLKYFAKVTIGDQLFDGEGPSKKVAKTVAAEEALKILYGIEDCNNVTKESINAQSNKADIPADTADKIVDSVQEKCTQVFQADVQYKVISSVIMGKINDTGEEMYEVISLGTGTKCISGGSINNKGQVLNDCHAEVIACRGLRQFLFDQLYLAMTGKASCMEKLSPRKYRLKTDFKLYLYINTAPCGDGRIFTSSAELQTSATNKSAGLLRTKIENGQGTVPVPSNTIQTTDGILEGERLLTMSCSDKILKWNVLGAQGSLLSIFIDPVYFHGIIVGEQYHYGHLSRSLNERAGEVSGLLSPFVVKSPLLGMPSKTDGRDTSKASCNSHNWYYGQNTIEIVNGTTGKTLVSMPSRLCKMVVFDKFCQLFKAARLKASLQTYNGAKELATNYQKSKQQLFQCLEASGYGKWVGKPMEQDMFG